mgnify:CR=1 FL=1
MKREYNSDYEEHLTLEEIRKMYSLEYDEDVQKFVEKVNRISKGTRIVIISKEGDDYDQD